MKNALRVLAIASFMILLAAPSYAWVSVSFRMGGLRIGINPFWPVYPVPAYYAEPVYQEPAADYPPAMIPDAEAVRPAPQSPQNHLQLPSGFHERLTRAENILNRQITLGGITQVQYDRETKNLTEVANDEQKWSLENSGSIYLGQLNNLDLRLKQIELQIQRDLAE